MAFKGGDYHKAILHFEKSLSKRALAWIYLYLAKAYLNLAEKTKDDKPLEVHILLEKLRSACNLCRSHDLQEKHQQELELTVEKAETLLKNLKMPS